MKLIIFVSLLVLLSTVLYAISADNTDVAANPYRSRAKLFHERDKRSSFWTAWRQIVKGARFVEKIDTPYKDPLMRYSKFGGRKQALRDFKAIKPTAVEKFPKGEVRASVGDSYHISLRTNHNGDSVLIVFGEFGAVRSIRYIERPGDNIYTLFKEN